jgi:hypothetical protein
VAAQLVASRAVLSSTELVSRCETVTSVTVSCVITVQCSVYSMFHHEENGGRSVQSLSTNQNDSLHEDRVTQVVANCQSNQYYAGK